MNILPVLNENGRNEVWDACEQVLGYRPATRSEQKLWGSMVESLRLGGANEEKILSVAEWYHRHWPKVDLTITALEKWYSHFLAMGNVREQRMLAALICEVCGTGGGLHTADCSNG